VKTKRVLLVEDEPLLIDLYQERFSEEDFDLDIARDGNEALKKADKGADLILLDILLPGINGFEVLRRLKKNLDTRDIPVIVLTNLGSEQSDSDKQLAFSLGAVDYLVKSYHTPDEMEKILAVWPHKTYPDEGMAVLSEPTGEQALRASDLVKPLDGGKIFSVQQLMVMDYPEGQYWPLYYAQSISLTRFLVEQGTPTRFVEFVRDSQAHGPEPALLRHYQIKGFADLQSRWLAFARTSTASAVQTAEAAEPSATR